MKGHVCAAGTSSGEIGCVFDGLNDVFVQDVPSPVGVAFDSSQNLWVSVLGNMTFPTALVQYSKQQLANLGSKQNPFPATVISSSVFSHTLGGLAFKSDGSLFVADQAGSVFGFSPAVLGASSTDATPTVTLTSNSFFHPKFIVFDKSDNLFVSDVGNDTVLKFNASQLVGGLQSPSVTLSGNGLNTPGQLNFDKKWNLYVPNSGDTSVLIYGANAATGASPIVTIDSSLFDHPVGAGFAGSLYFITESDGTIDGFSATKLSKGEIAGPLSVHFKAVAVDADGQIAVSK